MGDKKRLEKLIFCLLLFFGALFHHPVEYDNTASRFFLVSAIVDFGSFSIDPYHHWTNDKSFFGGRYYSNKAIGAPLLGVPVYWATRQFFIRDQYQPLTAIEKYLIRIVTTTLPFAVLGVVLFRTAGLWGAGLKRAVWVVFAYSFGSIALVHSTLFSGHQTAASFAFFSFFMITRMNNRKDMPEPTSLSSLIFPFLSGVFAGVAALADYTAIFIALVLSAYVIFSRMPWRFKIIFIIGGGICVLVLAGYNWACFGHPLSFSYDHLSFDEFKAGSAKGVFGISTPNPKALLAILMSPSRGLFFIMPVFLFSITGFIAMWRRRIFRSETLVLSVIIFGYIMINSGFYGWHGGWTFGPRYLVPMLPFLAIPMIFSPWNYKWFYLLFGISMAQIIPAVAGFPHVPQEIRNPVVEFILPCMGYGYTALNVTGWGTIPSLLATIAVVIILAAIFVLTTRRLPADGTGSEIGLSPLVKKLTGLWVFIIIFMLSVQRTDPVAQVNFYRSRLLSDAAKASGSLELQRWADIEARLAGLK